VKGPDLLLDAAVDLDPSIAIVFMGTGSLESELRQRAQALGMSSRVGFIGQVPDARVYLDQFDALVLPSRHEGIPMVVLEAAQAGLPVAAFDVGGISELLTDPVATRRVPACDTRALARSIEELLSDPRVPAAARQWGSSLSKRFSLDVIAEAYAQLYQKLAGV
jgi:glycosyltransferase involved in cell wall biosynthesis